MIQFDWRNSMVAVIIAFSISAWFDALGLNADTQKLLVILSVTLAVVTFGYLTIKHRKPLPKCCWASVNGKQAVVAQDTGFVLAYHIDCLSGGGMGHQLLSHSTRTA